MVEFHPLVQGWFAERYGQPTDVQSLSWPRIARREHLLITAPTGSGKTLTAFLWTLNRFATGDLATGKTRVLYISPLKALNNDIRTNLLGPLAALQAGFQASGEVFPDVRVATRSGDTDPEHRRRMLRQPPEILITTPESLNLLLSSKGGQGLLHEIDTLILDEIHSVVDAKRGVYLMSAVERVAALAGEFQRIALSATVHPADRVAAFVGGYERQGQTYRARRVAVLASASPKQYDISIRYPEAAANRGEDEKVWDYLVEDLLPRIHRHQSTLVFVNSRALCEKLTYKINRAAGGTIAYAHHGSLSREIRTEVETRLKQGDLQAIVATSSLEMGIDIGALDEVVLVQSPGSVTSAIQRIGRAGHQVGASSRCVIYPTHPRDFIEAAVLSACVMGKTLEPVTTIQNPLDLLGQIIISMTGVASWDIDELYAELRRSAAYHSLSRLEFDLVVNMLLGRYADHHIRELKPRVRVDRTNNRIEARKGALLSLYLSGGVIPDRGYFQLRHESDNARIGELDEEFVWEASVGQVFSLGSQVWQVRKITHNDVIVGPGKTKASAPPFWKAEPLNRSFHYSEQINRFLESANGELDKASFRAQLLDAHCATPGVADEIIAFLKRQQEHCGADLPHRHHLLFEWVRSGPGRAAGRQLVVHTGWGSRVNRPLAMALEAAWRERYGEQPEVFVANDSIVVQLPRDVRAAELLELVPAHKLEALLRKRLEGSGFFGARFRENAGRALLLSRGKFNERKPLWMSRLQSQKLMDAVLKYEDFPVLLETWRTCLRDEFDIDSLRQMLAEVESREIRITEVETATPSPFAQSIAWDQINTYMYMSDAPRATGTSGLREDLLRELVFSPGLRPAIKPALIEDFVARQQRLLPGYAPRDKDDLEDWVKERSLIPLAEWHTLLPLLAFEAQDFPRLAGDALVVSADDRAAFRAILENPEGSEGLDVLLSNWLQYYGPLAVAEVAGKLRLPAQAVAPVMESLVAAGSLISGRLIDGDGGVYVCDATNYEYLLRLQRARHRPAIDPKPVAALTPFMFAWQSGFTAKEPLDRLYELLERLRGLPLPAPLWEAEVLPGRLPGYATSQLDLLFQEGELQWIGLGERIVSICFADDLELIRGASTGVSALIEGDHARYGFTGLLDVTGLSSAELAARLWREVWQTKISNDAIGALRHGIQNDFKAPENVRVHRGRRGAFNRWRGGMPLIGNWYRLPPADDDLELLERQELEKDRARLLLARYGVVFRELCVRETAAFNWKALFRALRLMELAGEVVSGRFFDGIGPQYMTPAALRCFRDDRASQIFFINAADPISPCGLGLGAHGEKLPRRIPSNHLVYHGNRLVLTVSKRGRELHFHVEPDAGRMDEYLRVLHHLSCRAFAPVKQLRIETINGLAAADSPFLARIEDSFNVFRDYKSVVIQREL